MNVKRCIAGITLVLVSLATAGAVATSHGVAGSEGKWPKADTTIVQL